MKTKKLILILLALCLLLAGCGNEQQSPQSREPVRALQCIQPSALSGIYPVGGVRVAVCWADYEKEKTSLRIVDVNADTAVCTADLGGTWSLKEQTFADGRLALYNRDTNAWKFLDGNLEPLGMANTETVDGFFSYDGQSFYYVRDNVLCCQSVTTGERSTAALSLDLRLLDITAFDSQSGRMAVEFFLSPYGSECGTAMVDLFTGQVTMLNQARYQTSFRDSGMTLLQFDMDAMGYSALYCAENQEFRFADCTVFQSSSGEVYAVPDSAYLVGTRGGSTTVYALGEQVNACALAESGISGEMYFSCYLSEVGALVGAVYENGAFRFYAMDTARLPFRAIADAAAVPSPVTVDESLAQQYWQTADGAPVAQTLREARDYADALQERYGVHILLSAQCAEAAALCDHPLTLTDTMDAAEEVTAIRTVLDALSRTLALYPQGFFAQFQNGMGEGGVRFLLVEHIGSDYGAVGVTYESRDWQNIALDVRATDTLDSIICHELWHATENHILSVNYAAIDPDTWISLNPADFHYTYDPNQSDPTQKWTLYGGRLDTVYFVDSYACVDEREDRARIMEYFMVHEDEAALLIQSAAIRQKLQLMCTAVRSCFDTAGWKDVRWERLL